MLAYLLHQQMSELGQTPSQLPGGGCSVSLGTTSHYGNTRDICNVKSNKIRGCVYSIKLSARNLHQDDWHKCCLQVLGSRISRRETCPQRRWQPDTSLEFHIMVLHLKQLPYIGCLLSFLMHFSFKQGHILCP